MKIMISESITTAQTQRATALEKLLMKAKDYYYNKGTFLVVKGKTLTDAVYDKLEDELRRLKPTSKVLRKVRAAVTGRKTVKLPYYLGSLDKMRPGEKVLTDWFTDHPGPYVISDKLDGYSVPIVHRAGKWNVYSAGDESGKAMDITHLAPHLALPKVRKDMAVRGELLISHANFKKYSTEFQNPRNMVAGVVTRKTPHASVKHFDFIAHEMLAPRMKPSAAFAALKAAGFKVVQHRKTAKITEAQLIKYLEARKKGSKYLIDGLVVAQDKMTPLTVGSNPDSVIAFKNASADSIVTATVIKVIWTPSKHNYLKPVVQIKPIKLSGVTISRASGKNAYTIVHGYPKRSEHKFGGKKYPIGPGATVKLVRSGEVIPDILQVIKPAKKPDLPTVPYTWTKTGIDIVSDEDTNLAYDKRLANFFRTIGVENINVSTVTRLADDGLDTISKIIRATPARFAKVPGIQAKMANKLHGNIRAKINNVPLHILMDATGIFGRGLGTRKALPVLKMYPKLLSMADLPTGTLVNKLLQVPGYSTTTAKQFASALPKFKKWIAKTGISYAMPDSIKQKGKSLEGQAVCFTGFRDKTLEVQIEQNGGKIASGVSRATTVLLVANKADNSTKVKKAKELGTVKIMLTTEFLKKFKLK